MQKLIKDQEKPSSSNPAYPSTPFMNSYPSTSAQVPNLSNFGSFNPFPALTNLQALHQLSSRSPPAPTSFKSPSSTNNSNNNNNNNSNNNNNRSVVGPLDLSASSTPSMAKRIKLSPSSPEPTPQRQSSPNSVSTTNNQLMSNGSTPTFSQNGNNGEANLNVQCHVNEVQKWNVDTVCEFVGGIEICVEYVQVNIL